MCGKRVLRALRARRTTRALPRRRGGTRAARAFPRHDERDAERERAGDLHLDPDRRAFERARARRGTRAAPRARSSKTHSGASSEVPSARRSHRRVRPSTSGSAPSHCASIPSRGSRAGSCGTAGSSGRQRSTASAAACASVCGRLPMPVASPGSSTGARRRRTSSARTIRMPTTRRSEAAFCETREHEVTLTRPIPLWLLRIAWITLPAHRGSRRFRRAPRRGRTAPQVVAEVLLWLAWARRPARDARPAAPRAHRAAHDRAGVLRARDRRGARR